MAHFTQTSTVQDPYARVHKPLEGIAYNARNYSVPQGGIVRTLCYISFPLSFFLLTKRQHEKTYKQFVSSAHAMFLQHIVLEMVCVHSTCYVPII